MSKAVFRETIEICDRAFQTLETHIPAPIRVRHGDDFVFRYKEHIPEVVAIQKLSRISTGLKASVALLDLGLYQELGAVFRMLDEFREDVQFMCDAIRKQCISDIQRRFIEEFFQEEFDSGNPLESTQKRDRIPRRQIQAALANIGAEVLNPSDAQEVYRTLANTFSGYVHGSSVHILEMYGEDPPRYCLSGMCGTRHQRTFENTACEYFVRSLCAFFDAAMAFGRDDLAHCFQQFMEQRYGKTKGDSLGKSVQKMRRDASATGGGIETRQKGSDK